MAAKIELLVGGAVARILKKKGWRNGDRKIGRERNGREGEWERDRRKKNERERLRVIKRKVAIDCAPTSGIRISLSYYWCRKHVRFYSNI